MARSFGYDVLACPRCGGWFRLIALLEDAAVIQRILRHLGLPTEVLGLVLHPRHRLPSEPASFTPTLASRNRNRRQRPRDNATADSDLAMP